MSAEHERRRKPGGRWHRYKRAAESLLIVVSAPVTVPLAAAAAAAVLLSIGRPVLFRQKRIGRDEREFEILKFRTMNERVDRHGRLLPDKDRMTRAGRLLRRLSLDELPQLINVLRGDMSLVGPRPLLPSYLAYYRERERQRHRVRPGVTGLAQSLGRNDLLWNARLELDVVYVERFSARQDVEILVTTVKRLLRGSGVSVIASESGEPLDTARSYPVVRGLTMRRFERADIEARVRWMSDERTRRHMSLPSRPTEASTQTWLTHARTVAGRYDFTVTERWSDSPVAMLGLTPRPGEDAPELYIFVAPERHGRGIGTTALELLAEWMRRPEAPHECWLSVDVENASALSLYRRRGFVEVGTMETDRIRMRFDALAAVEEDPA